MRLRVVQHLLVPPVGALLGCLFLLLWSGLHVPPGLACCGMSMDFPFSCIAVLLALLSVGSCLLFFARKSGAFLLRPPTRWQQFTTLILSTEIRGWFVLSLLLSALWIEIGAASVFSLSVAFNWSALILGSLNIFLGLVILLLGLRQTRYPLRDV